MHPDLEQHDLTRRLRELPQVAVQPYDWQEFQRRAVQPARHALPAVRAMAAVTALLLVAIAIGTRFGGGWSPHAARPLPDSAVGQPNGSEPRAIRAEATVAEERWLASLPEEPAVVRVGTRAAVMGLEDRIAQVDDLLSAERLQQAPPTRVLALQRERSRLVGTLVQVRYAETLADLVR